MKKINFETGLKVFITKKGLISVELLGKTNMDKDRLKKMYSQLFDLFHCWDKQVKEIFRDDDESLSDFDFPEGEYLGE